MSYSSPVMPLLAQWPVNAPTYPSPPATLAATWGDAAILAFVAARTGRAGHVRWVQEQFIRPLGTMTGTAGSPSFALNEQYLPPYQSVDGAWSADSPPYVAPLALVGGGWSNLSAYLFFNGAKTTALGAPAVLIAQTIKLPSATTTFVSQGSYLLKTGQYAPKVSPINSVFSGAALYNGAQGEQNGTWFHPQSGPAQTLAFLTQSAFPQTGAPTFLRQAVTLHFAGLSGTEYGALRINAAQTLRFEGLALTQYGATRFNRPHMRFASRPRLTLMGALKVVQQGAAQAFLPSSRASALRPGSAKFALIDRTINFSSAASAEYGAALFWRGAAPTKTLTFSGSRATVYGAHKVINAHQTLAFWGDCYTQPLSPVWPS